MIVTPQVMWIHSDWKSAAVGGSAEHHPSGMEYLRGCGRGSGCSGVPRVADNAEDFRFAEVWASYTYGKSPQSGNPPH
jgi:hypothetical protein